MYSGALALACQPSNALYFDTLGETNTEENDLQLVIRSHAFVAGIIAATLSYHLQLIMVHNLRIFPRIAGLSPVFHSLSHFLRGPLFLRQRVAPCFFQPYRNEHSKVLCTPLYTFHTAVLGVVSTYVTT